MHHKVAGGSASEQGGGGTDTQSDTVNLGATSFVLGYTNLWELENG